jgi:hypothetical protein
MKLTDEIQQVVSLPDNGQAVEPVLEETPSGTNDQPAELTTEAKEACLRYLEGISRDVSIELPIVIPLRPKTTTRVTAKVRNMGKGKFNAVVDDAFLMDEES